MIDGLGVPQLVKRRSTCRRPSLAASSESMVKASINWPIRSSRNGSPILSMALQTFRASCRRRRRAYARSPGREDPAIEVGADIPVMRAELDRLTDRPAIGHRLQIAGRPAHRHDLVAIGPAALGVDVFPVEVLDGVVRRRSARLRGVLIGNVAIAAGRSPCRPTWIR